MPPSILRNCCLRTREAHTTRHNVCLRMGSLQRFRPALLRETDPVTERAGSLLPIIAVVFGIEAIESFRRVEDNAKNVLRPKQGERPLYSLLGSTVRTHDQ